MGTTVTHRPDMTLVVTTEQLTQEGTTTVVLDRTTQEGTTTETATGEVTILEAITDGITMDRITLGERKPMP